MKLWFWRRPAYSGYLTINFPNGKVVPNVSFPWGKKITLPTSHRMAVCVGVCVRVHLYRCALTVHDEFILSLWFLYYNYNFCHGTIKNVDSWSSINSKSLNEIRKPLWHTGSGETKKRRGKKITSLSNLVINSTNFFYPLFATQEDPRMNRNTH